MKSGNAGEPATVFFEFLDFAFAIRSADDEGDAMLFERVQVEASESK